MAYCFYNGVRLPELPSEVLKNYPYCWIRKNDNTQHYDLLFTKILGYYDSSTGGIVYGTTSGTTDIVHYRVAYPGNADDWTNYQTTNTWMALDANRSVVWSNHYIPNGSLTSTEMYFDGYEVIPETEAYQIQKDTVVAIADQVRRLCKTENTMTPAQIESNLGGLNIELMEAYVTSSEKDRVIYPDEGFYGFSKITVGGVDFGGGSGGGYLPDADNSGFGDNYVPEEDGGEVNTGNFFYGTSDTAFPAIPNYPETPYAVVYTQDWTHYEGSELVKSERTLVTLTAGPLAYKGKPAGYECSFGYRASFLEQPGVHPNDRIYRRFMADSGGWKFLSETINNHIYAKEFLWANHTITLDDEVTVWRPGTDPVPETRPGTQAVPAEYAEAYEISGASAYSLMSATQKITGITEPMTPTQAANALVDYYNQPKAEEVLW